MTVLETVVTDGGSGGDELYTMPSECEVCFVLEGEIEVVLEDGTYALGPGDALTFGAAVPHTWRTPRRGADPVDPRARPPRPAKRGHMNRYSPPDAGVAPRYTGIRTFARAPHVDSAEGVDAAILGVPFDTATSMRPGARFGPAGIRDASLLLRPWNPAQASTSSARSRSPTSATCTPRRATRSEPRRRSPSSSSRCCAPARRRSRSAATTRSCSASCARTPPSTGRSASCCSTPTPTRGSSTTASATSTARRSSARSRRA